MQSTQHASTCQVLLHPACTTNPAAVRAVQQATGQLVVVNGGKAKLSKTNFYFATGAVDAIPESDHSRRFLIADEFTTGPFGGDAA